MTATRGKPLSLLIRRIMPLNASVLGFRQKIFQFLGDNGLKKRPAILSTYCTRALPEHSGPRIR